MNTVVKQKSNCRFCRADKEYQSIKGDFVHGGTAEQKFFKCAQCGIIYLYPPLSPEEEARFYREEYDKYMEKRSAGGMDWSGPEKHAKASHKEMVRRLKYLRPYLKPGKRVLEVGCSSGFMLTAFKEAGLKVTGLDPSNGFLSYVRSKGIEAYEHLDQLKKEVREPFDLICFFFVLSHTSDPVTFLNEYLSLLKPGGVLIFEDTCASDPLVELYKVPAFDQFYWSIQHHWHFDRESLAAVLEKTGQPFRIMPEQRYDISNHMTWMMDGKPGGLGRFSHIFGQELDELYKEQLKKYWLCDTMVAFIEKEES